MILVNSHVGPRWAEACVGTSRIVDSLFFLHVENGGIYAFCSVDAGGVLLEMKIVFLYVDEQWIFVDVSPSVETALYSTVCDSR